MIKRIPENTGRFAASLAQATSFSDVQKPSVTGTWLKSNPKQSSVNSESSPTSGHSRQATTCRYEGLEEHGGGYQSLTNFGRIELARSGIARYGEQCRVICNK